MKIVEYKKHLINGMICDPEFIVNGGNFFNSLDNTWVGLVLEESERMYYVPDTLTFLTQQQLVDRQLSIHSVNPFTKLSDMNDPHSSQIELSHDEIISIVQSWIEQE